jgi:hypothetical protein
VVDSVPALDSSRPVWSSMNSRFTPKRNLAGCRFRHSWVSNDSGSLARVLIVSTIAKGAEYSS